MHIDEFDYDLPEELIAQYPAEKRDMSRLMVVDRRTGRIQHKRFHHILDYLQPGDCLVLNDSKVIPARLFGRRERQANPGAKIELLLLHNIEGDTWQAMARPGKKMKIGDRAVFASPSGTEMSAEVTGYGQDGTRLVTFTYEGCPSRARFFALLDTIGRMPLPPYIRRENEAADKGRYQTIYCRVEGSAAAPTAGLHFTGGLLDAARDKGVKTAFITLHVGLGTFRPVKCTAAEEHQMHFEHCSIDAQNAAIINAAKAAGGRVVCVGTTSVRTLESAAVPLGPAQAAGQDSCREADNNNKPQTEQKIRYHVPPGEGETNIFIYPGYQFKMADALITNFHLPKSTLLMLISALYDREKILAAYKEAIREGYRFFSYGDAMLIV